MDKYLIVGLGNVGDEYELTRHNTGFMVLDAFAKASNIHFDDRRYGFVAETSLKGRKVFLLKPSTFMNLSGRARCTGSLHGADNHLSGSSDLQTLERQVTATVAAL